MSKTALKISVLVALPIVVFAILITYALHHTIAILEPAGPIAYSERQLMFIALGLAAIVVIPVFAMTIMFAVKYRAGNTKAEYRPDWDKDNRLELAWWGLPMIIIGILSVITWVSSHSLDPYRPLVSKTPPVTVQVVALDWKWLFIYPALHVASVNLIEMPKNTPINLELTSDTVMNSFWIPQLSGQIYAMPGMDTQLHLAANRTGSFYGSPANISGLGFSRMTFTARSVSSAAFSQWVAAARKAHSPLNSASYAALSRPNWSQPVSYYSSVTPGMYTSIIDKYMSPTHVISPNSYEMAMGQDMGQ